jgi:hypothetical protein
MSRMSTSPITRGITHCPLEVYGAPGSSAYPGFCGSTTTVTVAPGGYAGAPWMWTFVVSRPLTGSLSRTVRAEVGFLPGPASSLMTRAARRAPCAWV